MSLQLANDLHTRLNLNQIYLRCTVTCSNHRANLVESKAGDRTASDSFLSLLAHAQIRGPELDDAFVAGRGHLVPLWSEGHALPAIVVSFDLSRDLRWCIIIIKS